MGKSKHARPTSLFKRGKIAGKENVDIMIEQYAKVKGNDAFKLSLFSISGVEAAAANI